MQRDLRLVPRVASSAPRSLLLASRLIGCGTRSSSFEQTRRIVGTAFHFPFRSFSSNDDSVDLVDEKDTNEPHFKDLVGLDPRTLAAMESLSISRMTPIQAAAYAPIAAGKDVLGRARTGTGKTFAFLIPAVQRILEMDSHQHSNKIQAIVLSPTRELALQIDSQVAALLKATDRHPLSHQTMFGGTPKYQDVSRMQQRLPSILVATPGRLADHVRNTFVNGQSFRDMISDVDILILDEADRYIDMGDDVPEIISALPLKRQTLLFSATLPESVLNFLHDFMKPDFERIDCISSDKSDQTSNIVGQSHVILKKNMVVGAVEIIRHFMELEAGRNSDDDNDTSAPKPPKILVFFPTTSMVSFYSKLFNYGLSSSGQYVLEIHSKKTQAYRTTVSQRFRTLQRGTLFSSDVSARGVDYPNVTHVIQVGLPMSSEAYVHRLGRTGRAGTTGEGILVLTEAEAGFLETLQLEGIQIPVNEKLQALVDAEDGDAPSKARRELIPVLESIRSNSNTTLVRAAEDTYRSVMGYYNGRLKSVGVLALPLLVEFCNSMASHMGLSKTPSINAKFARQIGLDRVPGVVLEETDIFGRRGQGGGDRRYRPFNSMRDENLVGSGNYGSWASGSSRRSGSW